MKLHEAIERSLCSRSFLVIRQDGHSRSDEAKWLAGLAFDSEGAVIGCRWSPDIEFARHFPLDQLSEVLDICREHPDLVAQVVRSDGTVVTLRQSEAGEDGMADTELSAATSANPC